MNLGEKIKYKRELLHLTQEDIANSLGFNKSTIQRYETNQVKHIKLPIVESIAKYLDVNPAWLLGQDASMEPADHMMQKAPQNGVKIPVLGKVQAGIPIDAIEEILDYEEISEQMARTGDFFALRIQGDSMQPRIYQGDVVIVKQQPDVDSGEIAIVLVKGNDATCKKVVKQKNGISLVALNPQYEPIFYTWLEVEELPVSVLGKVVELRGKF